MALFFNSILLELGTWVILAISIVYAYFQVAWTYWKKRGVSCVKPSFPFGNFADTVLMRKQIGINCQDIYNALKGERFVGTYMFTRPGILLRDPELIKACLVKDFSYFPDHGFYDDSEREPLFAHLFLLNGQRWKNLRMKLSPTFTSGKMKMMYSTISEASVELGEVLRKPAISGEVIDIKDIAARFSTDVISSCAFGIQCNCLKNPDAEFRQWGRRMLEPTFETAVFFAASNLMPSLMPILRVRGLDPKVSMYFRQMVRDTVNYREGNGISRNDFMQLLIQLKNKGVVEDSKELTLGPEQQNEINLTKLSLDDVAAQAFIFFIGGFETSSTTISFCLCELSINPTIQRRLQQEIDTVLAKYNGRITYEGINEMEYLDKVVSETLRKYPPATTLNRETNKPYRIPGTDVVLEKGTPVVIPVLGIHRDPQYYPNPERFDPDRFNEEEKAKRPNYTYLPFGEGPRICIGMRFGLLQTKTGIAAILSRYNVEISEKTPVPLAMDPKSVVLAPIGDIWLKVTLRTSS